MSDGMPVFREPIGRRRARPFLLAVAVLGCLVMPVDHRTGLGSWHLRAAADLWRDLVPGRPAPGTVPSTEQAPAGVAATSQRDDAAPPSPGPALAPGLALAATVLPAFALAVAAGILPSAGPAWRGRSPRPEPPPPRPLAAG